MTLFSEVPPSWTHLVRKVELVFVFSEGDCENARWYLLPWLVGWTKNGTLKEMTLTGYGATNFRQMLDIRKDKERNIHVDRWNRPGLFMPLFQLMQEAGVSEFDKLIGDHNLKRRLNVYIDDLHKVKARGNGWKHAIKSDDYHDALDEMHEYFGADLYAGGVLAYQNGKRVQSVVREYNPRTEKIDEKPSPFSSWYCVPKRKRDVLKIIRKRCDVDVHDWEARHEENYWDVSTLLWKRGLWYNLKEVMPFLETEPPFEPPSNVVCVPKVVWKTG